MVTLISPLETEFTYVYDPPPSCTTPSSLTSQPLSGSGYCNLTNDSGLDSISIQISKPGSSETQLPGAGHSGPPRTDRNYDTSSSQDPIMTTMPTLTILRRHSYDSMAYIYQSDYISWTLLLNITYGVHAISMTLYWKLLLYRHCVIKFNCKKTNFNSFLLSCVQVSKITCKGFKWWNGWHLHKNQKQKQQHQWQQQHHWQGSVWVSVWLSFHSYTHNWSLIKELCL